MPHTKKNTFRRRPVHKGPFKMGAIKDALMMIGKSGKSEYKFKNRGKM